MSNVRIMPLKEGGYVSKYESKDGKTPWGFIKVQSTKVLYKNGVRNEETRNALVRGPVAGLEKDVQDAGMARQLEGKIVVIECKESEIPNTVKNEINQAKFNGTAEQREAEIVSHCKRAGKDGPICMKDGERVLRFQTFTSDMSMEDVLVQHDNTIVGSSVQKAEELPAEVAE